jgi:hypothetical protein
MMCAGVAVFLLFKYFNSNRSPATKIKGRATGGRYRGGVRGAARSPEEAVEEEALKNQIRRLQEMSVLTCRLVLQLA